MGEVYRARDTKLSRDVAIKVLPDAVADDPERLARFSREAQTLASLNHPNIAAIYGLEESGGVRALVMELVEGDDLSQRIARGAIPLDEALAMAKQIADALEAAHEQGIIHRDLKPANIKVRDDGTVKVLDFGLAKALGAPGSEDPGLPGSAPANSPTLTARATQMGMILGTAAYMAPEQARGKAVDRRADVWAFGVVFYEMLTGQRAFKGEDVSDTLASVLARDADLAALPASTPRPVLRLIAQCLERDPKTRIRAIGDAVRRLSDDLAEKPESVRPAGRAGRVRPLGRVATLAAVLLTGAALGWFVRNPNDNGGPVRMLVAPIEAMNVGRSDLSVLAVAPDGSYLIYAAGRPRRLYMRRLDQMESVALPGTEGAVSPVISPDGESIGFLVRNQLKVIARSGGAPTVLHTFKDSAAFFSDAAVWAPDGTIYVGAAQEEYGTIWKIPRGGGTAEPVVPLADERGVRREDAWPQLLPGGRTLLFAAMSGDAYWECRQAKIKALDLASRSEKLVLDNACFVRYVETGHLIFATADNQLSIAPFDTDTLALAGPPKPLPFQVPLRSRRFANLLTAADGTLVYENGPAIPEVHLIWLDGNGKEIPVADQPRGLDTARLSPLGDRIAVVSSGPEDAGRIWMYDLARGQWSPVSPAGPAYLHLTWAPDGRSVVALRTDKGRATGVYRIAVDGAFAETLVYDPKTAWAAPWDVSPDGRFVAVMVWSTATDKDWDIQIVPLDGTGAPLFYSRESANESFPTFSPDGRWLAYTSDRSGRAEVFVKRFPEAGAPVQVSRDGGRLVSWDREGITFFSASTGTGQLVSVGINVNGASPVIGPSRVWLDVPAGLEPSGWRHWGDRSSDGTRLLLMRPVAPQSRTLGIALNWLQTLDTKGR
jgi:serine/threonine-protein kinase